jgi:hypothetical protein
MSETDCNQCSDNVPFLSPDGHSADTSKADNISGDLISIQFTYVLRERLTLAMPMAILPMH